MGHWNSPWEFDPEEFVGFVYQIKHVPSGRTYLGKKFFWKTIRKIVKNRKNRKKVTKPSDWKSYTGSSKELNALIELVGKDQFTFTILSLHESRSTLAFREVELLVTKNALRAKLADGSRAYFNGIIPPIKFIVHDDTPKELEYRDER